jgi:hypothetical protein
MLTRKIPQMSGSELPFFPDSGRKLKKNKNIAVFRYFMKVLVKIIVF